jgi:hypothetical protein
LALDLSKYPRQEEPKAWAIATENSRAGTALEMNYYRDKQSGSSAFGAFLASTKTVAVHRRVLVQLLDNLPRAGNENCTCSSETDAERPDQKATLSLSYFALYHFASF